METTQSNERFRILFVDDEQRILDGLRNILRRERARWDMHFALGGHAALEQMNQAPFDVLVTDMRMPGMSGVQLLEQVRHASPQTARIVLSGYAERAVVISALPVVHQYLSKPCDGETLRTAIERTLALAPVLAAPALRRLVGGLDRLPSVPALYWELRRAAVDPHVDLSSIAKIVEADPAMGTKVLQLVNSAYFGIGQHVASIAHAIRLLGIETLGALVLSAGVFETQSLDQERAKRIVDVQQRSVAVARLAATLFGADEIPQDELFTAGLIHNVGEMVLAMSEAPPGSIDLEVARSQRPRHVVEREMFGVSHAEIGAYLLGMWGMPSSVVEVAAYHHHPSTAPLKSTALVLAVHVADALVDIGDEPPPIDLEFLARCGRANELQGWIATARQSQMRGA